MYLFPQLRELQEIATELSRGGSKEKGSGPPVVDEASDR